MSKSDNVDDSSKENKAVQNTNQNRIKKMAGSNDQIQYDRLCQDWRQIHNIIWGIRSVSVSIFTGVMVAAYGLQGWQRVAVLGLGAIFLFAMTVETVKKSVRMDRMYKRIHRLEKQYEMKLRPFPTEDDEPNEDDDPQLKRQLSNSPIHRLFKTSNARTSLVYVCFTAAVVAAILTYWEFVKNVNYSLSAYWIGIGPPLIISIAFALVRSGCYERMKNKLKSLT